MRLIHLLRPTAALAAAAALASCDLVPGLRAPAEQVVADTGAIFGDTAGVSQPEPRPRRSRTRRPPATRTGGADPAVGVVTSDSASAAPITPPAPTAYDRARANMSADLRRLADAQSEHLANEGRYSSRLARLGLRYLPHAGVSVQLLSGDGSGWSAVATHENFPGQRCGIWVGEAPASISGIAPAEGIPGCTGR